MDKFLSVASMAWNPIGEALKRKMSGELSVGPVLAPFVGIVIVCNLFVAGAQTFFFETVLGQLGSQLPSHPLTESDFAQRMMAALGVLVPVGAVALLPAGAFYPAGRSATLAGMLIVAAGWAFYGAAIGALVYFVSGALATVDVNLGYSAYLLLSVPMILVIIALTLFFWFRTASSVLGLSGAQVLGISLVAAIAGAVFVGFMIFVGLASMPDL